MITVYPTHLEGVRRIVPDCFEDYRGKYIEIFNVSEYAGLAYMPTFVQDDISVSRKDVLRGIHGDDHTWKLVSCLYGTIYQVVVNWDPSSDQVMKHEVFILSGENRNQILIPPKFGNGHLVLSDMAIFHYKQSSYYRGEKSQFTIKWNDPAIGIIWPIDKPILSERDK